MKKQEVEYFNIGKIVNTHGVRGEVKVIPLTEDASRFELLDYVYVEHRGKTEKYTIQNIKYVKHMVVLKFEEVKDMNQAELLKQAMIIIPRDLALPLEEDEYYVSDLIGVQVETDEGEDLGKIVDVIFTGSNDVYVVKGSRPKEVLIPALKQCILDVSIQDKKMKVHLMKGLIEE